MKETKAKVYSFNELDLDAKRRLYTEDMNDIIPNFEIELEEFTQCLEQDFGASDVEYAYSIFGGQGDGVCFTADFDVDATLCNLDYWQCLIDDLNSEKVTIDDITVVRCGHYNYYCHENTCTVEIAWIHNEDCDDEFDRIQDLITNVESLINEDIRGRLIDLRYKLENEYAVQTSFEHYCTETGGNFPEEAFLADGTFVGHLMDGEEISLVYQDRDETTQDDKKKCKQLTFDDLDVD